MLTKRKSKTEKKHLYAAGFQGETMLSPATHSGHCVPQWIPNLLVGSHDKLHCHYDITRSSAENMRRWYDVQGTAITTALLIVSHTYPLASILLVVL